MRILVIVLLLSILNVEFITFTEASCSADDYPKTMYATSGGPATCTAYPCTECDDCAAGYHFPEGWSYFVDGSNFNCVCPANQKLSGGSCVACDANTYKPQYLGYSPLIHRNKCVSFDTAVNEIVLMEDNAQYGMSLRNFFGHSNDDFTLATNPFIKSADATPRYGNIKVYPQSGLILSTSETVDLNSNVEVAFGHYAYLTPMKQNNKHYVAIIAGPSEQGTKTTSEIGAYIYSRGASNWVIEGSEPKLQPPNVDIKHLNFGAFARWRHNFFGFFYKHTSSGTEKGEFNLAVAESQTVNKIADASITDIDSAYVCPDFNYNPHAAAGEWKYRVVCRKVIDSSKYEIKVYQQNEGSTSYTSDSVEVSHKIKVSDFNYGYETQVHRSVALDSKTLYYIGGSNHIVDKLYKRTISSTGTIGTTETEIKDCDYSILEIKTHPHTDGYIALTTAGAQNYYLQQFILVDSSGTELKKLAILNPNEHFNDYPGWIKSAKTDAFQKMHEIPAHESVKPYVKNTHFAGESYSQIFEYDVTNVNQRGLISFGLKNVYLNVKDATTTTKDVLRMHLQLEHAFGCPKNFYGDNGVCTVCPSDKVRAKGDDPDCTDCACYTPCAENTYGNNGVCTACPTGSTNPSGDQSTCTDCACTCPANYFGNGNGCTACAANTASRAAGDLHTCTTCKCECLADFFGNNGACTACPTGNTNAAGDNQMCTTCACDPPVDPSTGGTTTINATATPTFQLDDLTLSADTTIVGNGATITVGANKRAFVAGDKKLVVSDVTIVGGDVYSSSRRRLRRLLSSSCDTPGAAGAKECMGGVAHTDGGTLEFTDTVIKGGNAKYGGCLYGQNGATIKLTRTIVVNCTIDVAATGSATDITGGAGVYLHGSSSVLTAVNSDFTTNKCGATNTLNYCYGGAIYLTSSASGTITGGTMKQNEAIRGGALALVDAEHTQISGATLTENKALFGGGAVVTYESPLTIKDTSKLVKNEAALMGGGIWYIADEDTEFLKILGSVLKVNKVTSPLNTDGYLGGALTTGMSFQNGADTDQTGKIEIRESTFCSNTNGATAGTLDGDHIYYRNDAGSGADQYRGPTVTIVNTEFKGSEKSIGARYGSLTPSACSSSPCTVAPFSGTCEDLPNNEGTKCECGTGTLEPSFLGTESCCSIGCAGAGECILCEANDKSSGGVCVDCDTNKYSLGNFSPDDGDTTCEASCQDAPNDANCLNVCAANNYVAHYATNPPPQYGTLSGQTNERTFVLTFNEDVSSASISKDDFKITGTYMKVEDTMTWNVKFTGGSMIASYNGCAGTGDAKKACDKAAARKACKLNSNCVGIQYSDVGEFVYPGDNQRTDTPTELNCCDSNSLGCTTGTKNYVQCTGTLIETKTFDPDDASHSLYTQRRYMNMMLSQAPEYCKDLGNCGCFIVDDSASSFEGTGLTDKYTSLVVRFYTTNGCSSATTSQSGTGGVSCEDDADLCQQMYGLFETTTSKMWQTYSGSSSTEYEFGDKVVILGTPTSTTGDMTISAAEIVAGKVILTIDNIEEPGSSNSLMDTTTVTVVAYTKPSTTAQQLTDSESKVVDTFSGGPTVATTPDPGSGCAAYPCYKCEACNAGSENDGGDNPGLKVRTACKPTTSTSCAKDQEVLYYVCTNCAGGKHNAHGASLNTHTENGAANNFCCANGLHPNAAGTECEVKTCNENERVDANGFCVACSGGNRDAGDKTDGGETQCFTTPGTSESSNALSGSHDIGVEEDVGQKLVDYDNDGILDIVYYRAGISGTAGANTVVVFINEGTNASPDYQRKFTYGRTADKFVEPIADVIVKDFNNDGKADILVVGTSSLSAGVKSGSYVLLKGGSDSLTATSNVVTTGPMAPITVFDKNADGYLDICGSGTESGVDCKVNKADGTIASFDAGATYKGQCATGKYSSVAMDKNTALLQLNHKGSCTENLYDLELAVNQQHTATLTPALTAAVNDAKWIDIDNDGDDELAVLTDNELQIYEFTRTTAYSYPQTLSETNVDTSLSVASVISSHTTEAAAVTACDGDSECIGVQLAASGSWEAVKGQLAYKKVASQQTISGCVTTGNPRYYLPKSCSDLAIQDDKFHCFSQFTFGTDSGKADDYFHDADLGAVSPTSLSELPAACIFDSEADVENKDKIETCLTTANNFYVNSCAATTNCIAIHPRWNEMEKNNGHKKIGDKWVLITTNLKQGDQSPSSTQGITGCYESNYGSSPNGMQYYRVESSGITPKFKPRVASKTITAGTGTKITAYSSDMNEIVVADVRKTGTPQLVLSKDSSTTTAMVISIDASDVAGTTDFVKLKTVVPAVTSLKLGRLTSSTFSSPVQQDGGLTVNAVPSQTDTSLKITTVNLPVTCDTDERAVNGICEECPAGSTSSGVLSPTDTPNTGCIRADNTCLVDEYVLSNKCGKCVSPNTNAAGDDASGSNTDCDCVNSYAPCEGGIQKYIGTCEGGSSITCSSTGASTCAGAWTECDANGDKTWYNTVVPSNGDFSTCTHDSGYKVGCVCNGVQYAENGLCVDCPTGATANLVDYDPASGNTVCLCQGAMSSDGNICAPCGVGQTNALKDYDPTSGVSECFTQYCSKNQRVVSHNCEACPHNSQRLAGDDPAGPDTHCHCKVNSKVIGGDCLSCETGSTNPKLCYASKEGGDVYCTCDENYFGNTNKTCEACPSGSKNEAGDYAGDGPTYCNCKAGFHVVSGVCSVCPDNSGSGGGDELDGGDSFCLCSDNFYASGGACVACPENTFNDAPTKTNIEEKCRCNANFKVVSNECVACELTSTIVGGGMMSGADTYCICGENEKVQSNTCVACETGGEKDKGDDSSGPDTECECKSNFQKVNGECAACPDGTMSAGGGNDCVCKANHYVKATGTCEECPTGSTATGGNNYNVLSTCKLESGYYVDSNGDVQQCPDGSTSNGGELINGGETKCKTTANHYVDTNGDVQDCPSNSEVPGGVFLEVRATISGCICNKGYQAVGTACGECPEGQTTDGSHRTNVAQQGCHCKEGFYVDDSDHSCKECSTGGSTAEGADPNGASTSCDCAANYRVNANSECEQCNPGETNAPLDKTQDGETQCDVTKCALNERVENKACVACPAGMVNAANDPANSINTICDYMGDTEDQYEFDVSGTEYLVQKKDGTNLGLNPTIELRISEGPFVLSRQPASTSGDDLIIANDVVWTTPDTDYASYTQLSTFEAKDDVSVIVWVPNTPGTFYYLSKDTSTMVGKIEVSLPLCNIPTSGTVQLSSSCILPQEIVLTGDLQVVVLPSRRRMLRKKLKSTQLIIQAAASSRHFSVPAGNTLTISGMTLSEGNPGDAGGSILASGGTVVAENILFKDNVATTGGAIEAEKDLANNEPSVTIKTSTFDNNEGTNGGGAINAKAGSFVVEGSTFKNNKATSGNGGAVSAVTDITFKTSIFEANSAPSGSGGAVAVEGKLLTMEATTLKSNSAQNGGALEVKEGSADLRTIIVESNSATDEGGAILVDKSDVNITSSNLKSNTGQKGGGIKTKNMGGKKLESDSNTFSDNSGSVGGGAFHFEDELNAIIKIFGSAFSGNKGVGDEADDMKSTGDTNIVVKIVDLLGSIARKGMPAPDCATVDCSHRVNSNGKAQTDGSCRCACDGTTQYEKDSVCTAITVCQPGDVAVVNATDSSDRICGSPTIAQKQASFDSAGAALSSLVANKLKESGLGDADAFNLAVDMIGGVNKC